MPEPEKGRIAIKFGSASSSTPKPAARPKQPPSALGKRPRAWGHDDDDDDDDDQDDGHGRHEAITAFGADGAETEGRARKRDDEGKRQYVIARQPNQDWRAELKKNRRGGRNLLPEEAQRAQNGQDAETAPADQDSGIKWGLTVKKKEEIREEPDVKMEEEDDTRPDVTKHPAADLKREQEDDLKPAPQRSADDEAMDALLGRKQTSAKPTVIPSEIDAYRRDIQAAGADSTLDDYEAMPVEEFGAALLRGMGWDGKKRGTTRHREVKRRPNGLGLGAKELKDAEDLGAWNQGGGGAKKRSRPRLDEYNREEMKRKEGSGREDSYKRERERERDRERYGHGARDRGHDRHRYRHREYDRDRRR
ncbi:Pre-mRNA-splicing factor-like protein [Hapsidospora chrysogenum ATCC 11550]|uniref:Pre-mRNA-splicing factor n=1 Tax=Hapsidospora chrysogenum (strain ATCC 11550 / CBS 779.69 / DSM 880 / IAM 14645 / JCM 23072 / IMI 49137) TaxID=857340 RepID=A0A086T1K2_HAPC1|nr:Pre-mRNA-splicing factor-like protein [Hapsidospora chrysogenum ATCC 11550]